MWDMNKAGEIKIGERIIFFERDETNHYQVASPKQQSRPQFTLHITWINFQVVFLRITSENVQPSTQFIKKYSSYKETFKLDIFIESR